MCPAVAYEMLVSHSPPVFSHSPPTGGFLADYPSFRLNTSDSCFSKIPRGAATSTSSGGCKYSPPSSLKFTKHNSSSSLLSHGASDHNRGSRMPAFPKRPCLVIRPEDTSRYSSGDEDPSSPTKLKKKVVFADDKGMSLTHVRVMTEPSNVPPVWSFKFLAEVTQGMCAEPEAPQQSEPWEITFPQPASDYVEFRKRLDTDKVSLENVIVKESDDLLLGTVKVSNISYHKEVFVRISSDNWKTFEDAFCNYVSNAVSSAVVSPAYVLYDTFSFKIPLPPKAHRLEFCVCYRCNDQEFWDNNRGKNYVISKKTTQNVPVMHKSFSADDIYTINRKRIDGPLVRSKSASRVCPDAPSGVKLDAWSEFASWTHLENSTPYY